MTGGCRSTENRSCVAPSLTLVHRRRLCFYEKGCIVYAKRVNIYILFVVGVGMARLLLSVSPRQHSHKASTLVWACIGHHELTNGVFRQPTHRTDRTLDAPVACPENWNRAAANTYFQDLEDELYHEWSETVKKDYRTTIEQSRRFRTYHTRSGECWRA